MTPDEGLKRSLGMPALLFFGLGAILGAGIYSVIGVAAGVAGPALWQSFLCASAVAALSALSYAELSTMFAEPSAEYAYLRHALPRWRWPAFVVGLLMAGSAAATTATVSLAFAGYAGAFLPSAGPWLAVLLVAIVVAVSIWGIRESAWMAIVFTLIEAGGLVLVVIVGAGSGRLGEALSVPPSLALLEGSSIVFFSFLGFENIANLAGEAKKPDQSLAPAILGSLALASVLYVLVALAAVALLPANELATSSAPLSDALAARSPTVARWFGAVALFATANTALAAMLSGSRVLFGVARGGDLPGVFGRLLPGRKTPWVGTLVVGAMAGALLPLGGVKSVASVSSFASLIAFAGVNVAVIVLRFRAPDDRRPFRVPLAIGRMPVLPILGALASLVLAARIDPLSIAVVAGFVVLVTALHLLLGRWLPGDGARG